MSKMATITIDGKEVKVPEGTNLIDAAEKVGVHIPNLCYIKGMKGIGACRLCLVEVEGGRGPAIACNTRVKDGMAVNTKTDQIIESRKFVIDMILSMHPMDCMTCTKAGVCQLQKYAYDLEVKESTFTRKKFGYPTDEANPCIKRDPEYCIICGRCVRVCEEQGTNVLDFMGRGVGAKVITENDKPLQESECTFCGSCVDACPVNALLEADRWRKGREWEYAAASSACTFCGNGCQTTAYTSDGEVQKVRAAGDEGSASKYICARGRFGYDYIVSDTRITSPMKKDGNKLVEITWDEALEIAAKQLKAAGKNAGIITNAAIQNEDASAIAKLAKDVLKTTSVDSSLSLYANAEIMTASQTADLDAADLIVMVGLNTSQHDRVLPALDAAVMKRVKRGAKLVVVNSKDTGLDAVAAVKLGGAEPAALKALAQACVEQGMKADKKLSDALKGAKGTDEASAAAELMAKAETPVILSVPALFDAANSLATLKGSAVAVGFEANAKGVALMGLAGKESYKDIAAANKKVLYVIGEQASAAKPKAEFMIVQQSHMTALAKKADLVLPAAVSLESAGSIVDYLGNLRKMEAAVTAPDGVKTNKEIVIAIAKALGKDVKISASDINKAATTKASPAAAGFDKVSDLETSADKYTASLNSALMGTTRMLWLKETPAPAAK